MEAEELKHLQQLAEYNLRKRCKKDGREPTEAELKLIYGE